MLLNLLLASFYRIQFELLKPSQIFVVPFKSPKTLTKIFPIAHDGHTYTNCFTINYFLALEKKFQIQKKC